MTSTTEPTTFQEAITAYEKEKLVQGEKRWEEFQEEKASIIKEIEAIHEKFMEEELDGMILSALKSVNRDGMQGRSMSTGFAFEQVCIPCLHSYFSSLNKFSKKISLEGKRGLPHGFFLRRQAERPFTTSPKDRLTYTIVYEK